MQGIASKTSAMVNNQAIYCEDEDVYLIITGHGDYVPHDMG